MFLMLHIPRQPHRIGDPDKQRDRIFRQHLPQMVRQGPEIRFFATVKGERDAACAAVVVGQADPVDVGIVDTFVCANHRSNFLSR